MQQHLPDTNFCSLFVRILNVEHVILGTDLHGMFSLKQEKTTASISLFFLLLSFLKESQAVLMILRCEG